MSIPAEPVPAPDPGAAVAVAVVAGDGTALTRVLDAAAAQSYETRAVGVVGGGAEVERLCADRGCAWFSSMRDFIAVLTPELTHVWLLHEDALPRRDALVSLVGESARVDAAVAGSKLLQGDHPELLESVGAATDVFCVPYVGLDPEEMDQEQYDVVRDVAFVSGVSVLVRKDLFRGLGGTDPRLAPESAGIDLSQRARLAGGRVVVVPSSEVLHQRACAARTSRWREEAGRIRSLLKVYRPVTLIWTVPLAFVIGLVSAVAATFLGRWRALPGFVLAWVWNLLHLPSTISGRRRLRPSRLHGDEELFRYQVRGSAQLRELGEALTLRVRDDQPGRLSEIVDRSRAFWQDPGFYATLVGLLFVVVAGRVILAGRAPATGLMLPLGDSGLATLRSYAGGWNTAGLGSPAPLHPAVGIAALVQLVLVSEGPAATVLLTLGASLAGMIGVVRLLRPLGVGPLGRYAAAATLLGGPATRALAGAADWPALMALGVLPWAVGSVVKPWPVTGRGRAGYLARAGLFVGVLASLAPVALLLPLAAVLLRAAVGGGWGAILRAVPATALGIPLLLPWLYWVSATAVLEGGRPVFFSPSGWAVAGLGVALLLSLIAGDESTVFLAGWGGILAAGGALLGRTAGLGLGREPAAAGLLMAALGSALVVGAAADLPGRLGDAGLWRRLAGGGAVVGALVAAAGALLLVPGGRLGLPADAFGGQLDFATARAESHGPDRILLVGPAEALPGDSRSAGGYSYRLVPGSGPLFAEGWLSAMREGDTALAEALASIETGQNLRPGGTLAPFGVRWVVFTGPSVLQGALESQLDMRQLPGLPYPTFENEVFSPRAVGADGRAWRWERPDYVAPRNALPPVVLAENADRRWGEDWRPAGWANEVGATDRISFAGDRVNRRGAIVAAAVAVGLVVAAAVARERTT